MVFESLIIPCSGLVSVIVFVPHLKLGSCELVPLASLRERTKLGPGENKEDLRFCYLKFLMENGYAGSLFSCKFRDEFVCIIP